MKDFHYVFILASQTDPDRHYTGLTNDLKTRLKKYNAGKAFHSQTDLQSDSFSAFRVNAQKLKNTDLNYAFPEQALSKQTGWVYFIPLSSSMFWF